MSALRSRCGHYIFALWFLLSFFPCLISAVADWMSTILLLFHTWCGLSANLGCRSQTCCTRMAANTACKKIAKKSPSGHHRTTLSGYIFALGSVTARHSSNGHQPNSAALNRERHLYAVGRPSRWALTHILVCL